jgi:hypothetical protein
MHLTNKNIQDRQHRSPLFGTGLKKRMPLAHPSLTAFEPQLARLLELAFGGGVRSLEAAGFKLGDDLTDMRAQEHYRNGLFWSFAEAQNEIGETVLELEATRRGLERDLKAARQSRTSFETIIEALAPVTNRIMVLRRLVDGLLYVAISDHSLLFRLALERRVRDPEPTELRKLLTIAAQLNRLSPRELNFVCDLTCVVQLGDILRVRWDESGVYIRLQELKHGKINDILGDQLDNSAGRLSDEALERIASTLGPHAVEQTERMARQRERFGAFTSMYETARLAQSEDPELARLAHIKPPGMETYLHLLPEIVTEAKAHDLTFHCIDDCLWVIGISEAGIEKIGDAKNLQHELFHSKHAGKSCHRDEIAELNRESPLVNLVGYNLVHTSGRPPLAWYPREAVVDLIMDRVRIYAQFDLWRFFEVAAQGGCRLSLITGREAEEGKKKKLSGPMLEDRRAYGVKVDFLDGRTFKLVSSFFHSVYSQLVRPSGILAVIAAMR